MFMYLISGGSEEDMHARIVGVAHSYDEACELVDRLNEKGEGGLYYDYTEVEVL